MIKTIFPSKDATLYELTSSLNTGIDEILEITKIVSSSTGPLHRSRALIQFDTSTVSASLSTRGITTQSSAGNLKYYLKLFVAEEVDVPLDYDISIHAVSQSWDMGIGRKYHKPQTLDGVSWKFRDGETVGTHWTGSGTTASGSSYFSGSHPQHLTTDIASQSFSNTSGDIEVDVTSIVEKWHDSKIPNNGFLIRRSGSQETSVTEYGSVNYFSRETNTIFPPRLEARFDTPARTVGNMIAVTASSDITVQAFVQPEYRRDSEARIEIFVESRYPARSDANTTAKPYPYYLPVGATYSVIDHATDEVIIPHDKSGSSIEVAHKNYIDIDMNSLFPERYYFIQVKVPDLLYTGSEQYFDTDQYFRVIK